MNFIADYYLVWKSLHIISVISWMAALLYLPRLFVYHAQVNATSPQSQLFHIMEYRLLKFIATPAMIASYSFGVLLLMALDWQPVHSHWFSIKLVLVLILSGFQGYCSRQIKIFLRGKNKHNHKFYRLINEIPTIIMIMIVFLVVLKPFSG